MSLPEIVKQRALEQLKFRQEHRPQRIDNASLPAGSDMYYYCHNCGWLADQLPETHLASPRRLCTECEFLQEMLEAA